MDAIAEDEPQGRTGPALVGAAVAASLLLAWWTTLVWMAGRWGTDPFYSHGPLVPVVSLALLWSARRRFVLDPRVSARAVAVLAGAAVLHLLGVRLMFEFLSAVGLLAAFAGVALLLGGRRMLRAAAFPILYLGFAIPLPIVILRQISVPLQQFSALCARGVLAGVGCPVDRQGVLLVFPKFTLAVADACSGLRSLLTVLAIAALAAHLSRATAPRKALLVAVSSVAALLVNILRITLAGLIGVAFDGETACLLFEKYSGYFFFALVVLSTLGVFRWLAPRKPEAPPAEAPPSPLPHAGDLLRRVAFPVIAFLIPMTGAAFALKASRSADAPENLSQWIPSIPGWRTTEARPIPAYPGEEALTGLFRDEAADRTVRFSLLHSVSGRYLHSPEACSLAAGWIPERQEIRDLGSLPVHLWVLRRGDDRACVLFWFDLGGTPRRGSLDQHFGAVMQRLWKGRIDSAYGEVVIPLPVGASLDEKRLLELSSSLHEAVRKQLWP